MVVALLIVPPATAYLITTDLKKMLLLSSIFGILSAIGGYYLASLINWSIAGAIASVAGFLFLCVWVLELLRKKHVISI